VRARIDDPVNLALFVAGSRTDIDLNASDQIPSQPTVDRTDAALIDEVLKGTPSSFEPLILKYQPRVFATVRRYARRESEIEDIVQEVFLKAYQKLRTFRGQAPFEHWLMRLTLRTCYDFLRSHRRRPEVSFSDYAAPETDWLQQLASQDQPFPGDAAMAKEVVQLVFERLSPRSRLVLTLLELEDRSVKEVASLTGWSISLVKVQAFRARAEMRKCLEQMLRRSEL
jgi:RNA polymerase sigma-70 factor (ECF subfamily)